MRLARTHLWRAAGLVASVLALAGVVHANAPPGQYASFTQSARCIQDQQTKLTWQRAPLPGGSGAGTFDFATGTSTCASLGAGWRVPTVNELSTLVDEVPHFELDQGILVSKAIDANAFPDTPVRQFSYWTSSVVPGGTAGSIYAWEIDFTSGRTVQENTSHSNYVRCVFTGTKDLPPACN